MIAKQNSTLQQASETLYTLNCDQTIRDMARAREDAIRHENRVMTSLSYSLGYDLQIIPKKLRHAQINSAHAIIKILSYSNLKPKTVLSMHPVH